MTGAHDWSSATISRARKYGARIIEAFSNTEIFERDGWTCYLCSQPVNPSADCYQPDSATVDHVTPLSLGGDHSRANARCACFKCNSTKQATLIGACGCVVIYCARPRSSMVCRRAVRSAEDRRLELPTLAGNCFRNSVLSIRVSSGGVMTGASRAG